MSSISNLPLGAPVHSAIIPSKRRPFDAASPHRQFDSSPSGPENKRARAAGPAVPIASSMSKAFGKRPVTIDLTKPSQSPFEPNNGAKKLIVSRLRAAPRPDNLEPYYERRRNELADALAAIFKQQQPRQPLETLYRGVEDICRHGAARELYENLRDQCESYLNGPLQRAIMTKGGSSNVGMLRAVHEHWVIWNAQSVGNLIHLAKGFYS